MNSTEKVDGDEVGRGVIPGRLIRVSGEPAYVGARGVTEEPGQPRVEMIRDGDVLRAIDVVCSCGKRIRLRCVYSDGQQ
jgi:hypothetical protein